MKNLLSLAYKFDLDQSERKSTQVHASPGQTESQVGPSLQLASTCVSVWPGLNARRRSELYLYRQSDNCCFSHNVVTQSLVKGQTSFLGCKRLVSVTIKIHTAEGGKRALASQIKDTSMSFADIKENF